MSRGRAAAGRRSRLRIEELEVRQLLSGYVETGDLLGVPRHRVSDGHRGAALDLHDLGGERRGWQLRCIVHPESVLAADA